MGGGVGSGRGWGRWSGGACLGAEECDRVQPQEGEQTQRGSDPGRCLGHPVSWGREEARDCGRLDHGDGEGEGEGDDSFGDREGRLGGLGDSGWFVR